MTTKSLILLTFMFVCLSAQAVRGEEQQKSWWISPSIGFSFFGSDHGIKDNPVFAIGAGTNINEHLNFEGTLSYLDTETTGSPRSDLEIYQLAISLLYDIHPSKRLIPYLLVGGGGFHADTDEFGTKAGGILHYGAGLRYNLNSNLSIKGEVRHQVYLGMVDNKGERKTVQNLTTLIGLNLHFDQTHHPVTAALPAPLKKPSAPETVHPAATPLPAENIAPMEILSDDDLANVGTGDGRPGQLSAQNSTPTLTVTPRFNAGAVEILSFPPEDMTKLKNFFEDHPQARLVIMGEIDENTMCFSKYKIQEQRAQRVRIFLIDNFNIAPEKTTIMTQQSWLRSKRTANRNQTIIRFSPLESQPRVATQNSGLP